MHTPGPWRNTEEYDKTLGYSDTTIESDDGEFIAIVRTEGSKEKLIDNANLIAAAPELLEALQGIIDIGKRDTTNPKYDGYYEAAREAINKALGR